VTKIKYMYILFKILDFFIITLFARLYECMLLTCRKHVHDRIISLRGEA